ncbi:MAG: endonuclease III domain-containing protein [Candidatus Heimdallarchaeaceae archaeon]
MEQTRTKLEEIYDKLFNYYGPQNWWPGEGLEIAVGAVLTQQASWRNVEQALTRLKNANCLTLDCLKNISTNKLEELIRPSGFYRVKAKRLKNLVNLLVENSTPSREDLLNVNGLGPETADSILNYMFNEPIFVIDAYTFRILRRLGLYKKDKKSYSELQKLFMDNLPSNAQLYNEYHALLVKHAKEHCKNGDPLCISCPLKEMCEYFKQKKKNQ